MRNEIVVNTLSTQQKVAVDKMLHSVLDDTLSQLTSSGIFGYLKAMMQNRTFLDGCTDTFIEAWSDPEYEITSYDDLDKKIKDVWLHTCVYGSESIRSKTLAGIAKNLLNNEKAMTDFRNYVTGQGYKSDLNDVNDCLFALLAIKESLIVSNMHRIIGVY